MDKKISVKIDNEYNGKCLKQILEKHFSLSRRIITDLKKTADGILVNGHKVFTDYIVKEGDVLSVNIKDEKSDIPALFFQLDILFEDEDLIVLNKPRKMPTHTSLNHYEDTLANGLMYYYKDYNFTMRAITRLDRDTSGVVLVAKNPLSAALLSEAMKRGEIKKEYTAVVNGILNPKAGVITARIKRISESLILRCVAEDGKEAITEYETISVKNGLSYVSLKPVTGRTHQLRVHMQFMCCPIYGDDMYGAQQLNEETRLHCRKVTFRHPFSKNTITVEAPLPEDIKELI